ncbi:SDR family NAD(P)-dependent oxidoreductase [Thermodesulfobacteriota bacterium]
MEERKIFDLSGKVALVTGGGRGLGRVFCESLAEFGADIACVDVVDQNLTDTVTALERFGGRAVSIKADISKPDEIDRMVDATVRKLGTIDILFNNAGITDFPSRISETPIEKWERIIAVNLTGVFLCMRAVLPVMLKQKKGSIINISSIGAFGGSNPEVAPAAYGASKAGVISLTKMGAVEYAREGIRVNCIAPGMHDTGFGVQSDAELEKQRQQDMEELISRIIPMGRVAQPVEIKGLAVYLASDASSFVTGQVFIQDGGQLAQI